MEMPAQFRRQVIHRAQRRCEYCGLSQASQEAVFHIDHATPVSAGGETVLDNLALACVSCSLRKGARQSGPDPQTAKHVSLFNPRRDSWSLHFRWNGVEIVGISPTGRATVAALALNRTIILAIRAEDALRGKHPPPKHL
jgi:hypothetical protein